MANPLEMMKKAMGNVGPLGAEASVEGEVASKKGKKVVKKSIKVKKG